MRPRRPVRWRTAPAPIAFTSRDPAPDPAECQLLLRTLELMSPPVRWVASTQPMRDQARAVGAHPAFMSPDRRRRVWRRFSVVCAMLERWFRCGPLDIALLELRDELTKLYAPDTLKRSQKARRRGGRARRHDVAQLELLDGAE